MERISYKTSVLLLFLVIIKTISANVNVPSVYIFGDSIFDAGNNHYNPFCGAQADFPPYGSSFFHHPTGRFTNGRTVADFLAQFLGLPLQNPFQKAQRDILNGTEKSYPSNGINFASAGSGVLSSTNQDLNVTSLEVQLQQFKSLVEQNHIDKETVRDSLFLFESGSNDIFNYFIPTGAPTSSPDAYVEAMSAEVTKFLDQIHQLGARRIALFSLGPVGCVPARALLPGAPTEKCHGKMNGMVKKFNSDLENLVKIIPAKFSGSVAVYGAVYDAIQLFRGNPGKYGFSNISNACCGSGILGGLVQCGKEDYTVCSKPDSHLFWDYFHPSERTYKLVSKALWSGDRARVRPINLKALADINITTIRP